MPRCPNCAGALLREPASVRCLACGCRWEADADDEARLAQRLMDWARRPRSIECWPGYQDLITPPKYPVRGWVKLPVGGQAKRRVSHANPVAAVPTVRPRGRTREPPRARSCVRSASGSALFRHPVR